MAAVQLDGNKGGKKSVDTEIALIPFIDLLLCCVMFLLVTAAWSHMARIDTATRGGTPDADTSVSPPSISLQVAGTGTIIESGDGHREVIAAQDGQQDVTALRTVFRRYATLGLRNRAVLVSPDDDIEYAVVIEAMDAALGEGFSGLSVTDSVL